MRAAPDQLRWVIDDVIPHTAALRALMGDVTILPGRDITPATICDADILLVRSITPVNESLLAGSSVQFVGTQRYCHQRKCAICPRGLGRDSNLR